MHQTRDLSSAEACLTSMPVLPGCRNHQPVLLLLLLPPACMVRRKKNRIAALPLPTMPPLLPIPLLLLLPPVILLR